ncbi:MAG: hypothetical protein IIB87_04585 [Chloroflexi bacterium]|nr:hypothetical protein [Chloroflexota bacterium]
MRTRLRLATRRSLAALLALSILLAVGCQAGGGSATLDDAAYFIVKRTINGNTVRYIERVHSRRFTDVRDCFFVDCGLTFDNPITISAVAKTKPVVVTTAANHGLAVDDEVDLSDIVWAPDVNDVSTETQPAQLNGGRYKIGAVPTATTLTLLTLDGADVDALNFNAYFEDGKVRKAVSTLLGFHHLAGEDVIALCDGSVVRGLTVSATGSVALPRKFSRVHLGFPYFADWELLDIEAPGAGTLQGRRRNVHTVMIRLERSRGLWFGPNVDNLTELKQRQDEAYGEPTALLTDDVDVTLRPEWNSNGRVYFRQRDPLPTTILGIVPRFEIEGAEDEE